MSYLGITPLSTFENLVGDTTPQLGGNLDLNNLNFVDGDANVILNFTQNTNAVNYFDIGNATLANAPQLTVNGSESDIDLNITAKGAGIVRMQPELHVGAGSTIITEDSITTTNFVGTITTAAQPNITSVGTLTGFTSTGIDDNATSTQITIADGATTISADLTVTDNNPLITLKDADNTGNAVANIWGTDSIDATIWSVGTVGVNLDIRSYNGDVVVKDNAGAAALTVDGATGAIGIGNAPNANWSTNHEVLECNGGASSPAIWNWGGWGVVSNNLYHDGTNPRAPATGGSEELLLTGGYAAIRTYDSVAVDAIATPSFRQRWNSIDQGGDTIIYDNAGAALTVDGATGATTFNAAPTVLTSSPVLTLQATSVTADTGAGIGARVAMKDSAGADLGGMGYYGTDDFYIRQSETDGHIFIQSHNGTTYRSHVQFAPVSGGGDTTLFDQDNNSALKIDGPTGNIGLGSSTLSTWKQYTYASGVHGNYTYLAGANGQAGLFTAAHASYANDILTLQAVRAASTSYEFLVMYSGNGADAEFRFDGNGTATADLNFTGGGADYAEYFEWLDGNPNNEDRRGVSVVLDGNKVRPALETDTDIIGVVSAMPAVIGDGDIDRWKNKYLKDDFGAYVLEEYTVVEWTEIIPAVLDDGKLLEGETTKEHSYASDEVPTGIAVPSDATTLTHDSNNKLLERRTLNPNYDPSATYISREDRVEWDTIGLIGKLRIKVGQPVGSRWIKMRDVSVNVEEWLVR